MIKIFDTTLRDGEQSPGFAMNIRQKLLLAKQLEKKRNMDVLLMGPQEWNGMVKYYNVADVFVLPSRTEGIGIVYEESLVVGTPIIGFSESINEMEKLLDVYVGEKFDANKEDGKNLADKIIKILNKNIDREKIRKKAIDKLSWDVKFSEFEKIYKDLTCNY